MIQYLVFTEPGCEACENLQPELARWQRQYEERVVIVPISRGDVALNRDKNAVHLRNVLLQADREVAGAYLVSATPIAVLVLEGKIASNVAAGANAIRGLTELRLLPSACGRPARTIAHALPAARLPLEIFLAGCRLASRSRIYKVSAAIWPRPPDRQMTYGKFGLTMSST